MAADDSDGETFTAPACFTTVQIGLFIDNDALTT